MGGSGGQGNVWYEVLLDRVTEILRPVALAKPSLLHGGTFWDFKNKEGRKGLGEMDGCRHCRLVSFRPHCIQPDMSGVFLVSGRWQSCGRATRAR